jgi:hypothetical protein
MHILKMKSTRVDGGKFGFFDNRRENDAVEIATKMFGPPGTQGGRRWFYRVQFLNEEWRRKGRNAELKILLYFRNTADATFFCLKKSQN